MATRANSGAPWRGVGLRRPFLRRYCEIRGCRQAVRQEVAIVNSVEFSNYYATDDGILMNKKTGLPVKVFKSNKYLQCVVFDDSGAKHTYGVHSMIARLRLESWYDGCVVHHINGDQSDNRPDNLECLSRGEHTKMHNTTYPCALAVYVKKYGPPNKGKKMSDSFRQHCREGAARRYAKKKAEARADRIDRA